jgi:hypothetical protein
LEAFRRFRAVNFFGRGMKESRTPGIAKSQFTVAIRE